LAKFILLGATEKKAGVLVNIELIKFMHVMELEDGYYALQVIFGTNESYLSEKVKGNKKAVELFDSVYAKIYELIGPDSIPAHNVSA
jgi:hypothetical protein